EAGWVTEAHDVDAQLALEIRLRLGDLAQHLIWVERAEIKMVDRVRSDLHAGVTQRRYLLPGHIPWLADAISDDIKGGHQAVALQRRQRVGVGIRVSIVKGQRDRFRRAGRLTAQAARDSIHAHTNVALLVQPGDLAIEVFRRDGELVAQRIAGLIDRPNIVVHQDRRAPARGVWRARRRL